MALARFRLEADGVIVEGEGVVTVTGVPAVEVDLGEAIAGFITNLSPDALEAAALQRQSMGAGSRSLTADMLAVICEIATGKAANAVG